MKLRTQSDYEELIRTRLLPEIKQDIAEGRDITAIICGFGATSIDDYRKFHNALKDIIGPGDWEDENIEKY